MPRRHRHQHQQKSHSEGVRSKFDAVDMNIIDCNVYENHHASKSLTNMSLSVLTQKARNIMEDVDWDQKELDDFDEDKGWNEPLSTSVSKSKHVTKPFQTSHSDDSTIKHRNHGNHYPPDLWYWISKHIAPEDVLRFALICRTTNAIVHTTPFWINLLKKQQPTLNNAIVRTLRHEQPSAVRTYVVRSLYQSYPVFLSRAKKEDMINQDPYFLCGWLCTRIWYSVRTASNPIYDYFFEFRSDSTPSTMLRVQSALLRNENEYQIDEKTCILKVVSSRIMFMEPVMGQFLCDIALPMTRDYFHTKLRMNFNSSKCHVRRKNTANNNSITIEPVLSLKLYHWYDCPVKFE